MGDVTANANSSMEASAVGALAPEVDLEVNSSEPAASASIKSGSLVPPSAPSVGSRVRIASSSSPNSSATALSHSERKAC